MCGKQHRLDGEHKVNLNMSLSIWGGGCLRQYTPPIRQPQCHYLQPWPVHSTCHWSTWGWGPQGYCRAHSQGKLQCLWLWIQSTHHMPLKYLEFWFSGVLQSSFSGSTKMSLTMHNSNPVSRCQMGCQPGVQVLQAIAELTLHAKPQFPWLQLQPTHRASLKYLGFRSSRILQCSPSISTTMSLATASTHSPCVTEVLGVQVLMDIAELTLHVKHSFLDCSSNPLTTCHLSIWGSGPPGYCSSHPPPQLQCLWLLLQPTHHASLKYLGFSSSRASSSLSRYSLSSGQRGWQYSMSFSMDCCLHFSQFWKATREISFNLLEEDLRMWLVSK